MERIFDIFISGLALVVLSPLLVLTILILRFTGEGEIFFFQERIGKGGQVFKLFKFATMLKESPNIGTGTLTVKGDDRILPVGKFLRKSKVNELPQLLNIFLGNMSVIGPRPLTSQAFGFYSAETQELLKQVRPGLSGIGSIIFRAEEDIMHGGSASVDFYGNVIAPYKGALEEWFVSHKGICIYFKTIFITAWVVAFPNSKISWRVFPNLPEPPTELKQVLNFKD